MEEGFFLDGIALHSADIAPRNVKLAALVIADFADTHLSFCDWATMATGETADAVALDGFVEIPFTDVLVEDFAEGGQLDTSKSNITPELTRTNARCDGNAATGRPACARQRSERG